MTDHSPQGKPRWHRLRPKPKTPIQRGAALVDSGFFSEEQLLTNHEKLPDLDLYIATGPTKHNHTLAGRLAPDPKPAASDATETEKMRVKLRTRAGKKIYALRKQTVEPVIGIIKSVLGFRQFLLRGFEKVQAEWGLACLGYNLKRLFALQGPGKAS